MRALTFGARELRRGQELNLDVTPAEVAEARLARPTYRGQCEGGERPCPFLGCRHHLAMEVGEGGSLWFRFGMDPELEKQPYTCALDVADKGGMTLEETGALLHLTRERIRQIEAVAIRKLRKRIGKLGVDRDDVA